MKHALKSIVFLLIMGLTTVQESRAQSGCTLGSILSNDTTVCPGSPLQLIAQAGNGGSSCFNPAVKAAGNQNFPMNAVARDGAGNYLLAGPYTGTITLGGTSLPAIGGRDIFLVKYNDCGIQQWAVRAGSLANEDYVGGGRSVATDASGNIYVVGRYNGDFTFYGTGGTSFFAPYTVTSNAYHQDGFLVKLNPAGQVLWGATLRSGSNDGFQSVTVDNAGNPIVAGGFNGCCPSYFSVTVFGPNGSIVVNSFGSNYGSGILVKFDPAGNILWKAGIYNRDTDFSRVTVDANNNVYAVGAFRSWSSGTPAQVIDANGANNTIYNPGIGLGYLVKLNASGVWQWGVSYGNVGNGVDPLAFGTDVKVDANGNPWVCGVYSGNTCVFYSTNGSTVTQPSSATNRGFIAQYDQAGVAVLCNSLQQSNGSTFFNGLEFAGTTIGVSGYYSGTNLGSNDALLATYSLTATLQGTVTAGGAGDDQFNSIVLSGAGFALSGTNGSNATVGGTSLPTDGTFLWNSGATTGNPASVLWSTGATTSSISVIPAQSTTYYCTFSDGTTTCTDSVRVTVTNLNSNIFASDTIGACGSSYTLDAGTGYSTYLWSNNASSQSITVNNTGEYYCQVTQNGCTLSDTVFVSLVEVDIIQEDTSICSGSGLILTATGNGSQLNQSCNGNSPVNYTTWTSIAPSDSYTNIIKEGSEYYLRSQSNVLRANSLIGPWSSMNFNSQVGITGAGRMLGKDWSNRLMVATSHNSLYVNNNGTWVDIGLGGFGCSGNFINKLSNGRIIVEKNGFLRDLYISDNNGATWTNVTNVDNDYFDMIIAPNGNIYSCGGSNTAAMTGLIKSTNNGSSFSQINNQLGISFCSGFAKDCSGTIYAVADNKIFKSTDGNNWTQQCLVPAFFTANPVYSYLTVASNGEYYLWSWANPTTCGFFRSSDLGNTWSQISNLPVPTDNVTNVKEIDGNIVVSTTQGVYALTLNNSISFLWSTGATTASISVQPIQTTTYYCTVSNGITTCTDSVTITVNQPSVSTVSRVICSGSTYTLPGGTVVNNSGTYTDTLVSVNGCDSIITTQLTVSTPVVASVTAGPILCYGGKSEVTVSATGGTAPYSGTGSFMEPAGTYSYTVTDANGCTTVAGTITLAQPSQLSVSVSATPVTVFGSPTGSAMAVATGGTPGYTYSWNTFPAQTTATATGLYAGNYTVTVTDNNGCTTTASVIVTQADAPCSTFVAYQQGRWGSTANSNGPNSYLQSRFASSYPNGLQIGSCGRFLRLTSAAAVTAFLPSSGNSRQLGTLSLVNPTRNSYSNSMAGELVALNLNITFDSLDAAFAPSGVYLKNAVITQGPFTNWTVQRLYDEANRVIGCGGSTSYINDLTNAMVRVNSTGNEGKGVTPYLRCPSFVTRESAGFDPINEVTLFPNPTSGNATLRYTMTDPGMVQLQVFNATGQLVYSVREEVLESGDQLLNIPLREQGLPAGLYFIRFFRNDVAEDLRLVLTY